MSTLKELCAGLPTDPLPRAQRRDDGVAHAPVRTPNLTTEEQRLAIKNALRYFPHNVHHELAPEFAEELKLYGHIYMYRFRPMLEMRAYPVCEYPAKTVHAAALMHMIMNNLDPRVAQYPHELVTYGGNGQAFSNWAQFRLVMNYLSKMTDEQTLVLYSGHPMGLFPSRRDAPRAVITNGMVVPNYSSKDMYEKLFALGVTLYGQMTAGSFCYIGPQGIVHGTTLTIMNAARKHLGTSDLSGKVFLSSGLGGMSGAQAKAAVISGCIGVVAEVCGEVLHKRHRQGWVMQITDDLDECLATIREFRQSRQPLSLAYHGNIVDLWEKLVEDYKRTGEMLVDMGSDQTSCHNPFHGGYYPVQVSYEEGKRLMHENPSQFKTLVQESLRRQIKAINNLADSGMFFWDYGNAFLLECSRAGADVGQSSGLESTKFRYPSYVQDIMGDIFSQGFGPFRWVCTSGEEEDLNLTDHIAGTVMERIMREAPESVKQQYADNIRWIREAAQHKLVVGSQARILYSNERGRTEMAVAFNKAIAAGQIKGPVVLSRDHHDVSGTDSPYRETSNIYDGSACCADMAIQNVIGDSFRGATWIAIHNGGGVGWGEVINGGFGLVLDGSMDAEARATTMLRWDVNNGVARRCWSGNDNAEVTIRQAMDADPKLNITIPYHVQDSSIIDKALHHNM